jgi:hypothetical protein
LGFFLSSTHNLKDEDRMKTIRHKMVRDDDGNDYDVKMKFLVKDFFLYYATAASSINFNPIFPFSH